MNIPKPSPHDLEILGRLEDEYQVADRFSSGSVEAKHIRLIAHLQSQIATLTAERDEARKELAALRSAPGMEEVWWIRKGNYACYQYYDRAVAEAEQDGILFNYDRVFSDEEWASLGGEELAKNEIIAIRPLRIKRVEVSDGQRLEI